MKGYKAFKKGLVCKGKQYAENTVFEEPEAAVCCKGMHYCHEPLAVLDYYDLVDENGEIPEFAEVEPLDKEHTDDSAKFCTRKLKIKSKISLAGLIKAQIEYVKEIADGKQGDEATLAGGNWATLAGGDEARLAGGYRARLAGGNRARLAGGNRARLAGGDWATLAGGNEARLAGGYRARLAGGYRARLAGGDGARLAGGDWATLAGGNEATLAGGNWARLAGGDEARLAGGDWATLAGGYRATLAGGYEARLAGGCDSVIVGDHGSIAKGKKGALIVLVARDETGSISSFCAKVVDGVTIKEDVFYKLEDGEFKEAAK